MYLEWLFSDESVKIIQIVSGLGTLLAAIAGLWTLFVIKRQRTDSFKPRVIFGKVSRAVQKENNKSTLKTKWINPHAKEEDNMVTLEILNVGNGVAEGVTIQELWDQEKSFEVIKRYDKNNEFKVGVTLSKTTFYLNTTFDDSIVLFDYRDISTSEIGTIMPIGRISDKPFKRVFDTNYLEQLSCLIYLVEKYEDEFKLGDIISEFPKIKFEIKYQDIEGTKYKSKYRLDISAINLRFIILYITKEKSGLT